MGEVTGISWCDHTFNPWIGCTKVSAGCVNCYAARDNERYQWVKQWGHDYRLTSPVNWTKPITWAKKAVANGVTRRVFCASLADVFDINVPNEWFAKLFSLIEETEKIGGLEWLLLTKRPQYISKIHMVETFTNIRIGFTAENQEMFDRRAPIFFDNWMGKNFISAEPLLSDIIIPEEYSKRINWIIAGCESGSNHRPCKQEWVESLKNQCHKNNIPFFLKQMFVDGKLTKLPALYGQVYAQFAGDK